MLPFHKGNKDQLNNLLLPLWNPNWVGERAAVGFDERRKVESGFSPLSVSALMMRLSPLIWLEKVKEWIPSSLYSMSALMRLDLMRLSALMRQRRKVSEPAQEAFGLKREAHQGTPCRASNLNLVS